MKHSVFVTGGTGYMGRRLIQLLLERGHEVKTLVRKGSETKLPARVAYVIGDALQIDSYTEKVAPADAFVHLIGVPHPSPAKAKQFRDVDLVSIKVGIKAARDAGIRHFVYLSVAQPAPMMKAFIKVRREGEDLLRASGIAVTFVRPWYVLGPGHRWPYILLPFYWICQHLPTTKDSAQRLGLITIKQMLNALVWSVENPPDGVRVVDVPRIRDLALNPTPAG